MGAIGETLRREREKRNLGLDQISRELKINLKFLEAIEDEEFEKLPGGVFAKSFVRQYARLLGLDEEEMVAEVQRAIEPPANVPQFAAEPHAPAPEIRLPKMEAWQTVGDGRVSRTSPLPALAWVVVVMLACSGAYAWWQRQRSQAAAPRQEASVQQPVPASPPSAPDLQPPSVSQPATPQPAQAATAQVPPRTPPASTSTSAERSSADFPAPAAPRTSDAPKQAPSEPPKPPANAAVHNPNAAVRVEVTADDTVWVLAQSDGKYQFSGTLEPTQTRTVEANDKVLLRLGNAGGVSITLNGKPIGSVGPKGQVRTVQFTSGGFQIVPAAKSSSPDIL